MIRLLTGSCVALTTTPPVRCVYPFFDASLRAAVVAFVG
jgi:hypothetical protein